MGNKNKENYMWSQWQKIYDGIPASVRSMAKPLWLQQSRSPSIVSKDMPSRSIKSYCFRIVPYPFTEKKDIRSESYLWGHMWGHQGPTSKKEHHSWYIFHGLAVLAAFVYTVCLMIRKTFMMETEKQIVVAQQLVLMQWKACLVKPFWPPEIYSASE